MTTATFDSTKRPMQDLLKEIANGKMQLPDFQRGWVWDDDRIRSLLASLSVSFPIGAVMTLETGGESVRFKPRPIEGTDADLREIEPDTFILDGQQRLTSLFRALLARGPVDTRDAKGKAIRRWYYIDMKEAVAAESDREDAVKSVPEDRLVRAFGGEVLLDLRTPEREYAEDMFPAHLLFDSAEWRQGYSEHWGYAVEKMKLFNAFEREVIKRFEQYHVPIIKLGKETPKEAVCLVFEKVNTGGMALTVFELLTASFAAENFQLRDDWNARERRLKNAHPVLRTLQSDDFLQALSLLVTYTRRREAVVAGVPADRAPGISCKRRDILRLTVPDYNTWADRVEQGFVRAARFLYGQKIFRAEDLPYRTQLVPLAAVLVDLDGGGETDGARRQLARWYWCGVLGELYGGAIETRFARDLPELTSLVRGEGGESITIHDSNFAANRLVTLRTRNSAAYKGIYALLMRDGGCDFRTGEPIEAQTFFDDKIDIHHVFPKAWCQRRKIESRFFDTIINKTALSAATNRKIGGRAPSAYLKTLQRDSDIDPARMDDILSSHRISPDPLRGDDFWAFYSARAEELLRRIEAAVGKTIARRPELFTAATPVEEYDDGPAEWDDEGQLEKGAS